MIQYRLTETFLLLILSSTGSGLGSVVSRSYQYMTGFHTWQEAQNSCKDYTDLAVFYTRSDMDRVYLLQYFAWIGLHRDRGLLDDYWNWSDGGQYNFTNWGEKIKNWEDCVAVDYYGKKGWGKHCEEVLFFICHKKNGKHLEYTFIPESKTWSEAKQYCRMKYDDLASVSNSDLDTALDQQEFPVWIGLRRDGETWSWSTGFSDYSNWKSDEPKNTGDCVSISSTTKKMATQNCDNRFPYICMVENVVLISERKTWEEALEHCRARRLDLLSVQPSDDHDYLMRKVLGANTEEVWTGLRFLAGEWLWVNGADMMYTDLPLCPIMGHHCGAMSKKSTGSLGARDCLERKNFLCYSP